MIFKEILKAFNKENYIVSIENGKYVVKEKETGEEFFSMPVNTKKKELKLMNLYNNIAAGKVTN